MIKMTCLTGLLKTGMKTKAENQTFLLDTTPENINKHIVMFNYITG